MYTRFFRWATDRLENDGIITFITKSTFARSLTFDGLRKVFGLEFSHIYIVDLGGDIRDNTKLSGTKNNVFGIKTGVAIAFLVKVLEKAKLPSNRCQIFYLRRPEMETAEDKLEFMRSSAFGELNFQNVRPDKKYNWINLTDNDFDDFLALADKKVKKGKADDAVFQLFSAGIKTQRDEWVYDFNREELAKRMRYFVDAYQERLVKDARRELDIKWDRELEKYLKREIAKTYSADSIVRSSWRPFIKKYFYFDKHFNGMTYQIPNIFPNVETDNLAIFCTDVGTQSPFMVTVTDCVPDLHLVGTAAQCLPLYRYDENGTRIDNITDWGLTQFQTHYNDPTITKLHIFHYTYAVLHHPAYRTKYELNLKREFPRLPYYSDFHQWATWGKALMELHLTYETAEPYGLEVVETPSGKGKPKKQAETATIPGLEPPLHSGEGAGGEGQSAKPKKAPKPKLKADKTQGHIILDTDTTLTGVPAVAWDYKLGNRSALEWILDQYKEKKPKDPTIQEKFNTYRFADYKEHVIDLLQRVCTVSVETMGIIHQMPKSVEN